MAFPVTCDVQDVQMHFVYVQSKYGNINRGNKLEMVTNMKKGYHIMWQ